MGEGGGEREMIWGGGWGVNMCEAQSYIKKQKKAEKITLIRGGVVTQLGGLYPPEYFTPPLGGCKIFYTPL